MTRSTSLTPLRLLLFKQVVKARDQWGFAKHLERLVESGKITFPRQVAREVEGANAT